MGLHKPLANVVDLDDWHGVHTVETCSRIAVVSPDIGQAPVLGQRIVVDVLSRAQAPVSGAYWSRAAKIGAREHGATQATRERRRSRRLAWRPYRRNMHSNSGSQPGHRPGASAWPADCCGCTRASGEGTQESGYSSPEWGARSGVDFRRQGSAAERNGPVGGCARPVSDGRVGRGPSRSQSGSGRGGLASPANRGRSPGDDR
jgi:hypothetical protein